MGCHQMNSLDYSSEQLQRFLMFLIESPIDDLSGIGPYSYEPDASNSSSSDNECSNDDLDWFV